MVLIVIALTGGFAWIYFSVQHKKQDVRDAVARGEFEIPLDNSESEVSPDDWSKIYPNVVPLTIGEIPVLASVAEDTPSKIKGLSGTPFLPDNVVKLFVFGAEGSHPIWMKEMNYPLDIIWVAKEGKIVHIEEDVSPDSYPDSFSSPIPAWYVVEANAGFVSKNTISIGEEVVLKKAGN